MRGVGLDVRLDNGGQMLATYYDVTEEQAAEFRHQIGGRIVLTRTFQDGSPTERVVGTLVDVLHVDSLDSAVSPKRDVRPIPKRGK